MECLRKGEEKSENRRSIIVEAGALAVAANVEHLSLTSKNNIASIEQVRCEEFPSSKITNMTSPVYIQDKWNRSFVLMILLATSGLVVWNGVKWTAKTRRGDKFGQATDSPNPVEECGPYNSFVTELEKSNWFKKFMDTFQESNVRCQTLTDNREKMAVIQEFIKWMLESFEKKRKNVEKVESSFQPCFFVWSLGAIGGLVRALKRVDEALTDGESSVDGSIEAINEYMREFVNDYAESLSNYPTLKRKCKISMSKLSEEYPQLSNPSIASVLESSETISNA